MMNKTILITQPEHDYTTRYISSWAEKVIYYAISKNNKVITLKKHRANKNTFRSVVSKTNPSFIFLNGHGDDKTIYGQDSQPLLNNKDNILFLTNKIIYALSCQSAKTLGSYCINNGVKSYIGYIEDFIFVFTHSKRTNPKADKTASLFLDVSNAVPISLLKGKTVRESYKNSQNAFRRTIRKLLTSETILQQTSIIRFLFWDMKHQVCLGDRNARI